MSITGTRQIEEYARDILKGIGLKPNTATVQYVTEQIAVIVEHVVDFAVKELKDKGLLTTSVKTASPKLDYDEITDLGGS